MVSCAAASTAWGDGCVRARSTPIGANRGFVRWTLPARASSGTRSQFAMNRAKGSADTYRPEVAAGVTAPDVTIGIPTYNRSPLLRRAIESVLAQRYPHF